MIDSGFLDQSPITMISLLFRYGLKDLPEPEYVKFSKARGELDLSTEIDTDRLLGVTRDETARLFFLRTLDVLIHVGGKYDLPVEALKRERIAAERPLEG